MRRAARRAAAATFEAANAAFYLLGETILCPLWDKYIGGYDFDAYEAALEQDRIARSYEGE